MIKKLAYDIWKYNYDSKNKNFGMIMTGTGGSGKSFTINAIRAIFKDPQRQCRVTATTGAAAFRIGGCTLHSLLKLPVGPKRRKPLKGNQLALLQEDLKNVDTIIVDEISMLGLTGLYWVDQRLRQASGKFKEEFGGFNLLFVGDFAQLPPVCDAALWSTPPSKKYKQVLMNIIYQDFFPVCVKLKTSRRQTHGDEISNQYRAVLNRMKDGKCNLDDWKFLKQFFYYDQKEIDTDEFKNVIRLFPDNESKVKCNLNQLDKMTNEPKLVLKAKHNHSKGNGKNAEFFEGLEKNILVKKGARIMITNNLWCAAGVVNGATGTIKYIVYDGINQPPKLPSYIIVQLDEYNGPPCFSGEDFKNCIPLQPITKQGTNLINGIQLTRTQYPIVLAYALTIHKSQGASLDAAVIDIMGNRKRAKSDPALTFVAFSRVRDITKCKIKPFDFDKFKADSKSKALKFRLNEEKRLDGLKPESTLSDFDADMVMD